MHGLLLGIHFCLTFDSEHLLSEEGRGGDVDGQAQVFPHTDQSLYLSTMRTCDCLHAITCRIVWHVVIATTCTSERTVRMWRHLPV